MLTNLCRDPPPPPFVALDRRRHLKGQHRVQERFQATPYASFVGEIFANQNLLILSVTTIKYLFPLCDSSCMSWMSISRTSQGHRNLAGIITML